MKPTDIRPIGVAMHLLPVHLRVPLKIGPLVIESLKCLRVRVRVRDRAGRTADGWGETPLSAQWAWPSAVSVQVREGAMIAFCRELVTAWAGFEEWGHPMEVGHAFERGVLHELMDRFNAGPNHVEVPLPHLAALVCCASFDIALHDAFGRLHGVDIYDTYNAQWMSRDLAFFFDAASAGTLLEPSPLGRGQGEGSGSAVREKFHVQDRKKRSPHPNPLPEGEGIRAEPLTEITPFTGKFPADFFLPRNHVPSKLPVWHAIGGSDPVDPSDLTGHEPRDGFPVLLRDWIRRDGLRCLKVKLRGYDAAWDYQRMVRVAQAAIECGVHWLSPDFNCTVNDPVYVTDLLDRLRDEHPRAYGMILYVEQPFPYDLDQHRIDVRAVSARKPLFMDESAHDWRLVRLGRGLGWTGVALKTCKTQTGALLSMCWAKAHGMTLMVQDLTNPMLAIVPHVRLAAHAGTIMGVECNACQFYPTASDAEACIHPMLYERRGGMVDLSTLGGSGFGYRIDEITRQLPTVDAAHGDV